MLPMWSTQNGADGVSELGLVSAVATDAASTLSSASCGLLVTPSPAPYDTMPATPTKPSPSSPARSENAMTRGGYPP